MRIKSLSMTCWIYETDAEHIEIEGDLELTFAPSAITWLGIAEESDDHDH